MIETGTQGRDLASTPAMDLLEAVMRPLRTSELLTFGHRGSR